MQKLKNNEAQLKFTGSYKKCAYRFVFMAFLRTCGDITFVSISDAAENR